MWHAYLNIYASFPEFIQARILMVLPNTIFVFMWQNAHNQNVIFLRVNFSGIRYTYFFMQIFTTIDLRDFSSFLT